MHPIWRSQADVEEDLWALSEIEGVSRHAAEEPPPPTILEYRAQMAANNYGSVYDNPQHKEEGVTYIISGRGRGGISTILQPGVSSLSDNLITEDVQRKLRQVSGMGYSNELIQQGVRAMTIANNRKKNSPATVRQSSQVANASPLKTSGVCSPIDMERSSTSSSLTSASPHPEPVDGASALPLPLSVMRKMAQEQRMREKNKTAEGTTVTEPKKTEVSVKQAETPKKQIPRRKSPRPTVNGGAWRNADYDTRSDEPLAWRKRDNGASKGFNLNCNDFPALK